jgi:ABC-2 type transport system ATP-binding protein
MDNGSGTLAIQLDGLHKSYGDVAAVRGISIAVARGETCCMVGPNGAGKTTCVECVTGVLQPNAGTVNVFGFDPAQDRRAVFARVGVQLQEGGIYKRIRVREAIDLFATMYPQPWPTSELLADFGLEDCAGRYFGNLSGGEKRRVLVALATVGRPELLILDEPTTGLDPQARYQMWGYFARYVASGGTVLVTTHQLGEAEEHGSRIVLIDSGKVLADGTPRELMRAHGLATRVAIVRPEGERPSLEAMPAVTAVEVLDDRLVVYGRGPEVVDQLSQAVGADVVAEFDAEIRPASLEDLFLLETGRAYRRHR